MNNLQNRPQGNHIQEAKWEILYPVIENRKTDLELHLFNIRFLRNLVKNYFSELLICQNLDELRELQIEVIELQNQCEQALKRVQDNLESVENKMKNHFSYDASEFRVENGHFEKTIQVFITKEQEIRKTVFSMIKEVFVAENKKNEWVLN